MKIQFLGTGGAFDVEQGNSAALIRISDQTLLLDCGHAVFPKILRHQLAPEIDGVVITHFHDDHIGSLSSLVIYHTYIRQQQRLPIYVPSKEFGDQIIDFLSFSLGDASKRIQIRVIENDSNVIPIDTYGQHVQGMQTWGYIFNDNGNQIAYSGDLGQPAIFFEFLRQHNARNATVFHEVSFSRSPAHTYYKELENYLPEFNILGYHCNPAHRPADLKLKLVADHPELLV